MPVPLEHIPVYGVSRGDFCSNADMLQRQTNRESMYVLSQIPQLVDTTCVTGLGIVHIGHAGKIHLLRLMCWWPTGSGASLLLQPQTLQETRVHAAHVNIATSQGS